MDSILSALTPTCQVSVPGPETNPQDIVPTRWSDALVSTPYAVVTPSNIADIIATIQYANEHKLKVIPSGGAGASFVPITHDVIYLDLHQFSSFSLDEQKLEVTFGGGCISGPLLKFLAQKGYYTAGPNSNNLGMTGVLLGGLKHPLAGRHGLGVDMVKSFTIIPFSAPSSTQIQPITVSKESAGEEKKLWDVLRGAGHGMGVITSTTMEVHPISDLNLDSENKVWQRTLVFPPPALSTAISTYLALQSNVPPEMNFFLGFMRAPPTAPRPGAPVILLATSFFGPSSAAEKAAAMTFSEDVLAKTITANTVLTPFGDIHNALDPLNKAGGYKELHSALIHDISASSLERAFASFLSFTNDNPSRFGSSVIFPASNTSKSQSLATEGDFVNARDRGIFLQVRTSYGAAEEKEEADAFAKSVLDVAREEDRKAGRRDWGFANNLVEGTSLEEMYTAEQIQEIYRVNGVWNQGNVGWCPSTEEWRWYTVSREAGGKPGTILSSVLDQ